jgi:hypothetical protein
MKGRVCHLQQLLVLASAVILRSTSCGTHCQILLSQIQDYFNLKGQVPIFISPRDRVAQLHPLVPFIASYNLQGYCGGIRLHLHTGLTDCQHSWYSQYITSAQTAQKTSLPRIPLPLSNMLNGLTPSDSPHIADEGVCLGCCKNVFTAPLSSNGCLFWVHYSGSHLSRHNTMTPIPTFLWLTKCTLATKFK